MLELLNPTAMDVVRFASQTLAFKFKVQKLHKANPEEAFELAADRFLSPPASARRAPTIERLRDDSKRYFGWSSKEWKVLEPGLEQLLGEMKTSQITHREEKVTCYHWQHTGKTSRGRMLLCHGWEGYALNFAALISEARKAGWEVIAFDHLAHANSGGKHSGLPIALSTLLAVSEQVGKVDVLVGHSLGAAAAAWSAANQKIDVKRVVLLAPFYDTLHLTKVWAKAHFLGEDILLGMQDALRKTTDLDMDDFLPPALAPLFTMPVLIIHDPKDPVTSYKHSDALQSLSKKIKLESAKDTGHVRLLADANYISQIIDFCGKA